ncbi:hypothetical protein [Nitrogeniibacter aestuarii]|uniref:hypothetical protein n=1 Tax=Nitrogeniibacter aestuarii TaxID=2815343 RepID=UPI001E4CAC8C|nr:hypothetical protein [Nitrogeniibacter aestuarii]
MSNILSLASHPKLLPVGSLARHESFGLVQVIERSGSMRRVGWFESTEILSYDPEIVFEESIVEHDAWVAAGELSQLNPHKDVTAHMLMDLNADQATPVDAAAPPHPVLSLVVNRD